MAERISEAMFNLLHLYAQIDFFIMEACGAKIKDAPDLESKLLLALQVEEERRHFLIQQQFLKKAGHPYEEKIPAKLRDELMAYFTGLDWVEFLAAVQLGVEGIGIQAVKRVYEAHPEIREALEVPIREEERQIGFGLTQLRNIIDKADEATRQRIREKVTGIVAEVKKIYGKLPLPVPQWFEEVGLNYEELRRSIWHNSTPMFQELGIDLRPAVGF